MTAHTRRKVTRLVASAAFAKWYGAVAAVILGITTVTWSLLTAGLHMGNADQLINVFLFEDAAAFQQATLPAAHSFLLKWPLFVLVKIAGASALAFMLFTVGVALATVGALAYIVYRIDGRPLVCGTLWLCMASMLMLVPPQPYAGALLPVNMAMLTTRNLEYIVYILSLILISRARTVQSGQFMWAAGLLTLLSASDRLFLYISIGGALLAGGVQVIRRQREALAQPARWLLAGLIAGAGSVAVTGLLHYLGMVQFDTTHGAGPYGMVHSAKDAVLASAFALLGLATNLGANPAFDATTIPQLPALAFSRIDSLSGLAYTVNALLSAAGLYAAYRLLRAALRRTKRKKRKPAKPMPSESLALMLIWSTLSALVIFVASNHYYPVDARYMSIGFFALIICAATYAATKKWRPLFLLKIGGVIIISIAAGSIGMWRMHQAGTTALAEMNSRNARVAAALAHRPVDIFMADYWRAVPIKAHDTRRTITQPLATCTDPRTVLSSAAWRPDMHKKSFAYLLTLDKPTSASYECSLEKTITRFGQPSASALIAGSPTAPKEVLLFYERGAHADGSPAEAVQKKSFATPIAVDHALNQCDSTTIMNIVAHQDDDLLFMNPDLAQAVKAGDCIRTVYLTAGDAGREPFYWLGREQGSQAAYSYLLGSHGEWSQRTVQVAATSFVTIASPKNNPKISLIFMHLPDGGPHGQGFHVSRFENLHKLKTGELAHIHTVDDSSEYSAEQLMQTLLILMHTYKPDLVRSHTATFADPRYPADHSDHITAGAFARAAHDRYAHTIPIPFMSYIGYQVSNLPANVFDNDFTEKEAAFLRYATFDSGVCQSMESCDYTSAYRFYLERQYNDSFTP